MAPFCPFVADRLWRDLTEGADDRSVHLADWPVADVSRRDEALEASMAVARRLASLGLAARAEAGVKVRQPLGRALIFVAPDAPRPPDGIVEDELNVDRLDYGSELADVLTFEVVPNFRAVGPRLGEAVKELRAALAGLDPMAVSAALDEGRPVVVTLSTGDRRARRPTSSSCGCAARAASRSAATAPRWSRSTWRSPTTWPGAGSCATWCARSRTCARARASTSPTGSC